MHFLLVLPLLLWYIIHMAPPSFNIVYYFFCFNESNTEPNSILLLQNNITEIRTDALKLLAMLRRPIPRPDATIGAWLNIFQVCAALSFS